MYSFESRIRYSEVDQNQELSVTGIINYLQDCSTFQSEDLNLGITYLQEHHRAWWLSSWQIVIERYPRLGEEIVVSTWPYDFKGIYGYRNFTICDKREIIWLRPIPSGFSLIQKQDVRFALRRVISEAMEAGRKSGWRWTMRPGESLFRKMR